jgi:hypothetical protein
MDTHEVEVQPEPAAVEVVEDAPAPAPEEAVAAEQVVAPEAAVARDAGNWAKTVKTLTVGEVASGAVNLNVEGRRVVSPLQGFGRLWQKTYRMRFGQVHVPPKDVIRAWKQNFPKFWPEQGKFFGSLSGIAPGEVAVLNLAMAGRAKLSTGIMVMYADDESFTFMDPEGHMFAGWITFSAYELDGETVAQVQPLIRANDPLFELGMPVILRKEDRFWEQVLRNLAGHFLVEGEFSKEAVCVDRHRQWKYWKNVRHNAMIRSLLHPLGRPFRALAAMFRRKRPG